jgi:hypothetical protein
MSEERKKILEMVASRQISPEEGAKLLQLVETRQEDGSAQPKVPVDAATPPVVTASPVGSLLPLVFAQGSPPGTNGGRRIRDDRYWQYPLWVGLAILLLGTAVVTTARQQQRVTAWTWLCGWVPLAFGLAVTTIAAWSRTAHWIHVRVRGRDERVAISFPLPLALSATVVRLARPFIPKLRDTSVDEAILALREGLVGGEDILIDVRDDDEGESVNIDFGGRS